MSPTQPTDEPDEEVPEEVEPSGYAEQHFAMVPVGVLTSGVSHRAMVVYAMLRSYVRPGHDTFPRIATVAKQFGIPERTVQRGISELQDAGLLVVGKRTSPRGFRRANQYFFPNIPNRITDTSELAVPSASNLAVTTTSNVAGNNLSNLAEQEVEKLEVEKSEDSGANGLFPAIEKKPVPRKRASVMSPAYQMTEAMTRYAVDHLPGYNVIMVFEEFKNYWIGEGKAKVDWEATWRNRVLMIAERDASKIAERRRNMTAAPNRAHSDAFKKEMGWA